MMGKKFRPTKLNNIRFFICFSFVIIFSCNYKKTSKYDKDFNAIVHASIDSLSKDSFFGISDLENVIPFKDSTTNRNGKILKFHYSRYYANVSFYNSKTTLAIEVFASPQKNDITYLSENDDNFIELKLDRTYSAILINNLLYQIKLGQDFSDANIYLLNIKIRLLQCYIAYAHEQASKNRVPPKFKKAFLS